jgi:hypothetical protein
MTGISKQCPIRQKVNVNLNGGRKIYKTLTKVTKGGFQ